MKKILAVFILAFFTGFLTHALLFPDFLNNGLTDISQIALSNPTPTGTATKIDPLITKVTFDGMHFSRHNINVHFSRYIQITNTSQTQLMWLVSNSSDLTTPRGYGYMEMIEARMDKKGQFVVADKNNQQEKLVITVK